MIFELVLWIWIPSTLFIDVLKVIFGYQLSQSLGHL